VPASWDTEGALFGECSPDGVLNDGQNCTVGCDEDYGVAAPLSSLTFVVVSRLGYSEQRHERRFQLHRRGVDRTSLNVQ
jgi:hypothetical protein